MQQKKKRKINNYKYRDTVLGLRVQQSVYYDIYRHYERNVFSISKNIQGVPHNAGPAQRSWTE
jgi:hypothetical protein